jgi:YVTN family beta-propeller protein
VKINLLAALEPPTKEKFVKSIATLALIVAIIGLGIYGCGGGDSGVSPSGSNPATHTTNPVPGIAHLSPPSIAAGGAAFTLGVVGYNFVSGSVVSWNGSDRPTTLSTSTLLIVQISARDIAATETVAVTVSNPAGGTSNAANFIVGANPVPTISELNLSCALAGAQAFTLSVYGSNFLPSSVVRWNGSDRATTLASGFPPENQLLTAQIPASDIAAPGTAAVSVFNPSPGGGSSTNSTLPIAAGGVYPQSIAVEPTGKFAYVADEGGCDAFSGAVSMYAIDPNTGALTSLGSVMAPDQGGPYSLAVHPSGKFVYLSNSGTRDDVGLVSIYSIDTTTGALTSTGYALADLYPWSMAVHPSGKFAYVTNEYTQPPPYPSWPSIVYQYSIDPNSGALSRTGYTTAGLSPTSIPTSVAIDPSGKFAYVTNSGSNDVSMYSINATTGALTSIGPIATRANPSSATVDPTGKFAYVANSGSNDVSMYTIDTTTGTLTPIGPIAAGTNPSSVAVDPTGKFAYVSNYRSNDISIYNINATTGILTSIGTIAAGSSPTSIAVHPSGKFAYVANIGSNDVTMYSIDTATGALTLIGTIGT